MDESTGKRIAILLPDLRGGGVERVRLVLAHEFARQGHTVEFVLMRAHGELLEEARFSFPTVELGADRYRQVPRLLARYLREKKPDALLVAMWPLTCLCKVGCKLVNYRGRVVFSDHGILSLQYAPRGFVHQVLLRLSVAATYRSADARVAVSKGVARDLAALAFMDPGRFEVVYNPVPFIDEPDAGALQYAEMLWSRCSGKRILSIGKFKAVKNHALLLHAFMVLLQHKEACLMLLGNGELKAELRAQAASLGVDNRVIFAGFQSDPTPFYHTADLFVLSSDREGFGNVIVEALASGTPVVSTDCPAGPAEILEGGRHGRLVPMGDEVALAAAMKEVLDARPDPEPLRTRARDFSPQKAAARYLALLT